MPSFNRKLPNWDKVGSFLNELTVPALLVNNVATEATTNPKILDAVSKGQLLSKLWLAHVVKEELDFDFGLMRVLICGGWYGILGPILHNILDNNCSITSIDIDPSCASIANGVNSEGYRRKTFKATTADMFEIDYKKYDVIINTSTEHISDFDKWFGLIPKGKHVVMQNNDFYSGAGHINCTDGPEELIAGQQYKTLHYSGTLALPDYNRFMTICTK